MKDKDRKKKRKTFCSLFFSENCVFRQILWKQFRARYGKHDKIIRNMHVTCCLYKARHTHSGYVEYIAHFVKIIFATLPHYDSYTFVACCLHKARSTHSEYEKYIAFKYQNIYSTVPQYDGYTLLPILFCICFCKLCC
jgi:hypothetical protein